jgi:hypothetical protein
MQQEVKAMQDTVTVKDKAPKKEEDFLSELIPIQLDWSLEERIKIAEILADPEPRELQISESARKAIRDELMQRERAKTR